MSFDDGGFESFKHNLSECYGECSRCHKDRNRRDIYFNTRLDGMQLLFSVNEVGDLLSLMQEAQITEIVG